MTSETAYAELGFVVSRAELHPAGQSAHVYDYSSCHIRRHIFER